MHKATILIVEDEGILAAQLNEMISSMGYMVAGPLASGEEAIDFVSGKQIDLILMDIGLAGTMNGIAAAQEIQKTFDIPVVFLTGYSQDPMLEQAKNAAPYGYLIKPVSKRELAATLEMALHRHRLDRKLQESRTALKKSEAQYRQLFENSPLGIFRTTLDGKALAVNAAMAGIVGSATPEEAIRDFTNLGQQLYVDPGRRLEFISRLKENSAVDQFEYEGRKKNGETLWISMNARLTPTAEANGLGGGQVIDGFAIDITERKLAEKEKKNLQEQLQQAQKMEAIGALAGGIAHDFNNILGAILGYAEMAQEDCPAGSQAARDLDQVIRAGNRARDLVKQILAFSRQTAGKQIPLQPAAIVKEVIKLLRSSLPTTINIEQDIDPESGLIFVDPTQIHQVLMNLCTNAFHAMEETGGTLTISLSRKTFVEEDLIDNPDSKPGNYVQLSVRDTGSGIAPEVRARIFDPYFTTKEIGKGTGMGLAIVHGIVMSYGGLISCHSRSGEGTLFSVMLPAMEEPALSETGPAESVPGGSERILFIDDENMLVEMGQVMLERLGYRVTTETSSLGALALFKSRPDAFDLVITDQTMPGMTGMDLARRMLQIRPYLPIILCTGYSSLISESKARSMGIRGFILKPLTKKDIAALVRTVLDSPQQ